MLEKSAWGGKFASVRIGFGNVGIFDRSKERTIWDVSGSVFFKGKASIGHGGRIVITRSGQWTVGDHFNSTACMTLICYKSIEMGDDVLISWQTMIMDNDFHKTGKVAQINSSVKEKPISIGNHVWVGCRGTILKGVIIPSGCVVAACSVLSRHYEVESALIGGNPACIKKTGIIWEY